MNKNEGASRHFFKIQYVTTRKVCHEIYKIHKFKSQDPY